MPREPSTSVARQALGIVLAPIVVLSVYALVSPRPGEAIMLMAVSCLRSSSSRCRSASPRSRSSTAARGNPPRWPSSVAIPLLNYIWLRLIWKVVLWIDYLAKASCAS